MAMYQNISESNKKYQTGSGVGQIVVPGDVFETPIEQTSRWFKLVDEKDFTTHEKKSEQADEESKKKKKTEDNIE